MKSSVTVTADGIVVEHLALSDPQLAAFWAEREESERAELPVPAPAMTTSGPSPHSTIRRCSGVSSVLAASSPEPSSDPAMGAMAMTLPPPQFGPMRASGSHYGLRCRVCAWSDWTTGS
jgi:hypothetical protein